MEKTSANGWLNLWVPSDNRWHRKFCCISGKSFLISKRPNEKEENKIILSNDTKVHIDNDQSTLKFSIISHDNKEYMFSTSDFSNFNSWVTRITSKTFEESNLSMKNFEIISVIGRGCYGKVMLCRKRDNNQLIAIKSIHKNKLIQKNNVNMVLSEKNILSTIKHPFIVKLLYTFQSETKVYFALEYCPGGDMFFQLQNRKSFSIHDVMIYVAEIALALDSLHKNGIVYRDIKPENIVLDENGHVKIVDFGFSKFINDDLTSTFCGSVEYLAPEIIERKPYGKEVNWWALGALAYELLFGYPPFMNDNKFKLMNMIVNSEIIFPYNTDPKIQKLLRGLLNKDPKTRFKFEDLMKCDFFHGYDFGYFINKKIAPEFVPSLSYPLDTYNFAPEFTNEDPFDSDGTPVMENHDFDDFNIF